MKWALLKIIMCEKASRNISKRILAMEIFVRVHQNSTPSGGNSLMSYYRIDSSWARARTRGFFLGGGVLLYATLIPCGARC